MKRIFEKLFHRHEKLESGMWFRRCQCGHVVRQWDLAVHYWLRRTGLAAAFAVMIVSFAIPVDAMHHRPRPKSLTVTASVAMYSPSVMAWFRAMFNINIKLVRQWELDCTMYPNCHPPTDDNPVKKEEIAKEK